MKRIIADYYPYILGMALVGFLFRAVAFYEELTLWVNILFSLGSTFFLLFVWAFFDWANRTLNQVLPYENHLLKRVSLQMGVGLLFSVGFINTVFYLNAYIYKVSEVNKTVIVAGNLIWILMVLIVNGFFVGEYFFNKWKQALTRSIEAERDLAQVQFQNLQNQLNPHFLFNSLTTLNSLIYENPDNASSFLKQLAAMYRYLMKHTQDKLVPLAEELAFVELYLALLKTRFGEAFEYELVPMSQCAGKVIVPVTLQILIENTVKHNQMSLQNPLKVSIFGQASYVCVQNQKKIKKNVSTSHQIGLYNLQKLYHVIEPQARIEIEDGETFFTVKIPLLPI